MPLYLQFTHFWSCQTIQALLLDICHSRLHGGINLSKGEQCLIGFWQACLGNWCKMVKSDRLCQIWASQHSQWYRREFSPWVWKIPSGRKWQCTPVFLPGNSADRRAWWVAFHGIAESWTRLSSPARSNARCENMVGISHILNPKVWMYRVDSIGKDYLYYVTGLLLPVSYKVSLVANFVDILKVRSNTYVTEIVDVWTIIFCSGMGRHVHIP